MAEESKDLPSLANMPWWELYQDEELQRLIRIALEENKDLKRAVASIDEFQARLYTARMDFAPQLSVTGNLPIARMGGVVFPGFPSPFAKYGQGSLAWELDIWGRIRRANEAGLADLLAREESDEPSRCKLWVAWRRPISIFGNSTCSWRSRTRTLSAWEESVRIGQARLRQGLINKLDVDQFEAERENAAARIAELKRQMIQKENELSVLLGRNPSHIARGRSLTEQMMPPVVPAGLPSELLQRRPDVVQAEQQLVAVTARIGVAKAERFPKLSLTGLLGVASPHLTDFVSPSTSFGVLAPVLTGPLLNAQTLGFQQQAVEAQAKQAVAQYEQTILVAFREVEDALVGVSTAREQAAPRKGRSMPCGRPCIWPI
jgi:efflux transporter, outer membrane factor (OMF) lipoprotein, NodT family